MGSSRILQGYRNPQEAQNKNLRQKLKIKPQRNKNMAEFAPIKRGYLYIAEYKKEQTMTVKLMKLLG